MASPTPTMPPTNKDEQDSAYNPGEQAYREGIGAGYTGSGIDQAEQFANDPKNQDSVRKAEENPDDTSLANGFYKPSGSSKAQKITFKSLFKKKGPLGLILGMVLGGGGIFSILLSPGLGIIQLKEVLTSDLNDQLAAYDIRSDAVFKAKLKNLQAPASVCSNSVKIRCQFASMSKKQVERFKKAGFTVEAEEGRFGRQKVTSMVAPNGVDIKDPQDLINQRRDPVVRSALNKIHNPIYASLSDSTAMKVFKEKFKTSKTNKLAGTTVEELDESLAKNSAGDDISNGNGVRTDGDGKRYVMDGKNKIIESDPKFSEIVAQNDMLNTRAATVKATGAKAVTGVLSVGGSALKGLSIVGAADSACTVYNTARAVSAASKATRSVQLGQYAMVFLGTADAIKAGTATPEEVEYLGNILTATDTRETITDELSTTTGASVEESQDNAKERDNPFYKKSAFDSPGYKVAAYNEAPVLTTRSQQYMVGGGLSGTLSGVTNSVASAVGGKDNIRGTCGVIQSWWVRGAGLVVGIAAAAGSFGATTAISIGASLAIGMALPFLQAALADIIAGKVVGPETKGVDSGDAAFAGTSALLGGMAQSRGLKPLASNELEGYLTKTNTVKNEYIAQGVYEAKDTPLYVMNQYSFLGSFARTLNPTLTTGATSVPAALAAIPKFFSTTLSSIIPSTYAAGTYNPDRFNQCTDEGYAELNIAADVFCNVRYGLTESELAMDSESTLNYMLVNNHITDAGVAKSDDYKNFLKYCVDRTEGWGETGEESDNPDLLMGKTCMETSDKASAFRVFTIDQTVNSAMDDEEMATDTTVESGTVVLPVNEGFRISDGFGPRSSPCAGCSTWHKGLDFTGGGDVKSFQDGTVIDVDSGGNNTVQIQHADGLVSQYLHMYSQDITVKVGDTVTAGQVIGKMGSAGQSTGVHLHFELRVDAVTDPAAYAGYTKNPTGVFINPAEYLTKNGIGGFE